VFNPALWPVSDKTREQVIKNGTNQDISKLGFSSSERLIGAQRRFLTQILQLTAIIDTK